MATYYFDFAGGADSNAGTKVSPWKHHKYMAGATSNAAAMTHAAGDQYIFKGGVTWDSTCFQMAISAGGASTAARDYYGVDQTWYTGGSWSRPIFDYEYAGATTHRVSINANNVQIDNIEIKRLLATSVATRCAMIGGGSDGILISNCYVHGWRTSVNSDDAYGGIVNGTLNASLDFTLDNTEVENYENRNILTTGTATDSYVIGTGSKTFAVTGALSVVAGDYVQIHVTSDTNRLMGGYVTSFIAGSLIVNVTTTYDPSGGASHSDWTISGPWTSSGLCLGNVAIIQNGCKIHDNSSGILYCLDFNNSQLYNIGGDGFDAVYHYNGIYQDPFAWTTPNTARTAYIRNSYLHDCSNGANMAYPNIRGGATCMMYNCVLYGTMTAQDAINIDPLQYGAEGGGTFTAYNLTVYNYNNSNPVVHVTNRGTSQKLAVLNLFNIHYINAGSLTDQSASDVAVYNNSNNLSQSSATATSQGYVLANRYAPTSAGNSTVGAGLDESAAGFSTDIAGVTRSAPWDIGAYQFFAGGGATLAIKRLGRYLRLRGPSA